MPDKAPGKPEERAKNPEIEETRTSIDTLLELLKVKGKYELNSVAVALNIDPRIVENWAKVLENGSLIKISYKVGKMYLEPLNLMPEQQQDLKTRTDVTKFILEEDLAIERISLEKFSKNIEELNKSIGSMSKVYKSKMPDIERILADVDKAYAPLQAKKKGMDLLKDEAEKDFLEINKTAELLFNKLNAFSPKQLGTTVNDRLAQLNSVLQSISEAQKAMKETEINEAKFFKTITTEIDVQVKEFKRQIVLSKSNMDQTLRTNSRQLAEITKIMKDQVAVATQVSKELDNYRKDFERARHDLDVLKGDFADRYAKIRQEMEKDIKNVETESKRVYDGVKTIKDSFGALSNYDDEIRKWRTNMNDMSREVINTRTEIIKLTTQLNALQTNKDLQIEAKAKALDVLTKEGKKSKDKVSKIKSVLKETADEIKERIEESK
jgi:chromosome segregation ATPase